MKLQKYYLEERGMSFLLVFLTIILVSVFGISLLVVSSNSLKISKNERDDQSVFYIAEAALNYTVPDVKDNIEKAYRDALFKYDNRDDLEKSFESFLDNELSVQVDVVPEIDTRELTSKLYDTQLGKAPFAKIQIKREPTTPTCSCNLIYSITSTGQFEGEPFKRTVKQTIVYTLNSQPPTGGTGGSGINNGHFTPSEFIVQTKGNITITGGGKIEGSVTNAGGKISVSGGGAITGNIGTSSENFVIDNAGLEYLKQQVTSNSPFPSGNILAPFPEDKMKELSKIPSPPNAEKTLDNNTTSVINNGNFTTVNYITNNYTLNLTTDTHFKEFKVDQNNTLTINVGDSDKDLYIEDLDVIQGHIKIIGTGKLNIYVNNKLNIKGSFNADGDVNQVNFAYNGSTALKFSNETQIAGSLYAKNADLTFSGGVGIKGNIYTGGENVTFNGGYNASSQHIIAPNATVNLEHGAQIKGALVADNLILSGGAAILKGSSSSSPDGDGDRGGAPAAIDIIKQSIVEIDNPV